MTTRELRNVEITHVSYVDKGANQKQFFLTKSAEKPNVEKEVQLIINKEDEQQLVYGIVYEPNVVDSQGDMMQADEIEKSAHGFLKDARNIDKQHDFNAGVGEVVESYIAPSDFEIGGQTITKGSWVLVTKASDEIWDSIKNDEITGYSMAGTAEEVEKQGGEKPSKLVATLKMDNEMTGFFNLLKTFFAKGEVRDRYEENQKRRNLWAVWDGLEDTFYDALWENQTPEVTDFERLESAVQDFSDILKEIRNSGDIEKALEDKPTTIGKGEGHMKKEDIEKMLDEKLSPINERLEGIEKEEGITKEEEGEENEVLKQFASILDEKLSPINERLETVEKARGASQQVDHDKADQIEKSNQPSYLRHFQ